METNPSIADCSNADVGKTKQHDSEGEISDDEDDERLLEELSELSYRELPQLVDNEDNEGRLEELQQELGELSYRELPQLVDEVRQHVNLDELESSLSKPATDQKDPLEAFKKANNNTEEAPSNVKSCSECSVKMEVESVDALARGQHIAVPIQYSSLFRHGIIKDVKIMSGAKVEIKLLSVDNTYKSQGTTEPIISNQETTRTYDLSKDKLYIIEYRHPRYTLDKIVERAEKAFQLEKKDLKKFGFDPLCKNSEHFATWCVVGQEDIYQVKGWRGRIADVVCKLAETIKDKVEKVQNARKIINLVETVLNKIVRFSEFVVPEEAILTEMTVGFQVLYLLFCICITLYNQWQYHVGDMCCSCLKRKRADTWINFMASATATFGTYAIVTFVLPLVGSLNIPVGIASVVVVFLKWSIPQLYRILSTPFSLESHKIYSLQSISAGDIISFRYYGIKNIAIVTEVNHDQQSVICIRYAKPTLLSSLTITEASYDLDPSKKTVRRMDFTPWLCRPKDKVVELARLRVGETKWNPVNNRSHHLCFWAKVESANSYPETRVSMGPLRYLQIDNFLRMEPVHVMSDLQIGDVVIIIGVIGIVVNIASLDNDFGRHFEIVICYFHFWRIRKRKIEINLNKHSLSIAKYHPLRCLPMGTRVEKALLLTQNHSWVSIYKFLDFCINYGSRDLSLYELIWKYIL